jgi:hypothetical protein
MSARLVSCIPPDLHGEIAVSELLWSFFSSFIDGCSRWPLPDASTAVFAASASTHLDNDDAFAVAPRAIASQRFGQASEGQFHCTPSCCNASLAAHVSAVLAHHPDLGLAYDLFCSVIFDAGKIRKYSDPLFASISVAAKIFFQLLAAEPKSAAV